MNQSELAEPCVLCNSSIDNPIELGEMLVCDNVRAHYYCLLLCSNLMPEEDDDECGLNGFLPENVLKRVKRAKNAMCQYCKKRGASIVCCKKRCRWFFHLPCAAERECKFEFIDRFESYCHRHHGIKEPETRHSPTEKCLLCYQEMGDYKPVGSVESPCCSKWFHKVCLMGNANDSGYEFECPHCRNVHLFREELQRRGIFIPDRPATWEADSYIEQNERPKKCSAEMCEYSDGRDHDGKNDFTELPLIQCKSCESKFIHKICNKSEDFKCSECDDREHVVHDCKTEDERVQIESVGLNTSNASCAFNESNELTRNTCSSPQINGSELDVKSEDGIQPVKMNQSASSTSTATQNLTKEIASDDDVLDFIRKISRCSCTENAHTAGNKRERSTESESDIAVKPGKRFKVREYIIREYIIESVDGADLIDEYSESKKVKKEKTTS